MATTPDAKLATAIFGGQGYDYFGELLLIWSSSKSTAASNFIRLAATALQVEAEKIDDAPLSPFDLLCWLDVGSEGTPPPSWLLASAPVSYPLIFVTQIANYMNTLDAIGFTHEVASKTLFGAASGHSQGILAAAVVAKSADDDALLANSVAMARYALRHGCACQRIINHTLRENPEAATPMLSVRGVEGKLLKR